MLCIVSGSYAQQQKVQAKRGEGVTLLLQRYNLSPKLYEAEFRKLNKGKFTADGGLKMGVTYLLPSKTEQSQRPVEKAPAKEKESTKKEQVQAPKGKTASGGKESSKKEQDQRPKEKLSASNKENQKNSASKGYEPIFGKKYASYAVTSQELKNAVFYLVSGHGGPDPGAIGLYN